MKRFIITSIILLVLSATPVLLHGQNKHDNYFFNTFVFGSSLTYIPFENLEQVHELTWNINATASLGKHFFSGIQVLNIFVATNYSKTELYNIFGWFTHYNIAPYSRFNPFLEISLNKGNYYFPPDSYYPDRNADLFYVGAGGGINIPLSRISKKLFLDLSFIFYYHKQKEWQNDLYNQYIIGLDYRFGKMAVRPLKK